MKYLGSYKFEHDVVDEADFAKFLSQESAKYPNSVWQLRLYEKSHDYGYITCPQLCFYSKEKK